LTNLINERRAVTVQLGDNDTPELIHDLQILFMDNHVDNDTQTYRFYIEVPNTVLTENIIPAGPRFRTWRFKPGQRGLIRLPQKEWSDRLVVPAEAVAEDGVDHVIFQQVAVHDHFHGDEPPHSEFKKIVVKVDYKDQHSVVVDAEGQLKPRHYIATNNADMLTRAMNDGADGGGHAHHGHEH
jgi:multidrug efflux pump subunit AcrA (membrane-fusion protein)